VGKIVTETQQTKDARFRLGPILATEAALLAAATINLAPFSVFAFGSSATVLLAFLLLYVPLRLAGLQLPRRYATLLCALFFGLLQLHFSRLAWASSAPYWLLAVLLAAGHALWRWRRPDSRWAAWSALWPAAIVAALHLFSPLLLTALTAALLVVLSPLFWGAIPRRVNAAISTALALAIGWMTAVGAAYLADPAPVCDELPAAARALYLPLNEASDGRRDANLLAPGCTPGTYLAAYKYAGLSQLLPAGEGFDERSIARGQYFGFAADCANRRQIGVSFDHHRTAIIDEDAGTMQVGAEIPGREPDAVIHADEGLAVATVRVETLYALDADGRAVVREYPLAGRRELAYDATRRQLLSVRLWWLQAVDLATGDIQRRFLPGVWEYRLAVDEARRRVYALSFFAGLLFEVNLDDLSIERVHAIPMGSRFVLLAADGETLYLDNFMSGEVYRFAPASGRIEGRIYLGPLPRRLRLDHDGAPLIGAACGAARVPLATWRENDR